MSLPLARLVAALLLALAPALPALAQTWPSHTDSPITDDAEMLDAGTEVRLTTRLAAIEAATGARIEVVTLISEALYTGGDDIDVYARRLLAEWGLDAAPGNSVLLLIFRDDRALTVQTGAAYAGIDAAVIKALIDEVITPELAAGRPDAAVEAGVEAIIDRIVTPVEAAPLAEPVAPGALNEAPAETPAETGGGSGWLWALGLFGIPVVGIIALVRRNAAKLAATPCPACGKTGLQVERVTVQQATGKTEGKGETRTICPSCNHMTAVPYVIAKLALEPKARPAAAKAPGPSGDGSGASGKW